MRTRRWIEQRRAWAILTVGIILGVAPLLTEAVRVAGEFPSLV